MWLAFDLFDQFQKLLVFEPVVNRETELLAGRFDGKPRTMAIAGVSGGEDVIQLQRSPIDREILEITSVSSGAGVANGR